MTHSDLDLQKLAYRIVDCGFLEEEDIDPLYRKSNSLNNYLNSSLTEQTYNMGERKFDIKDVKSWFKREDYVQYDAYRNYDVAIIKLKHFTGCNIIDEHLYTDTSTGDYDYGQEYICSDFNNATDLIFALRKKFEE